MDDYDYFQNKRTDRIYLSRQIAAKTYRKDQTGVVREIVRPLRILSKKMEFQEGHQFIKDGKEVSLRITPGGKQEIVAKFYEDTRGITVLTFQKYTTETGTPHHSYFSFIGNEIAVLYNFIRNIPLHVGHGKHPATKQCGDLLGVNLVVFHLSAVYCFHVQGVAQNELDTYAIAQIRYPVPGKDALNGQDQVLAVRPENISEGLCCGRHVPVQTDLTSMVHDVDVHRHCVQIDAAVELMLFSVESHKTSSFGMGYRLC